MTTLHIDFVINDTPITDATIRAQSFTAPQTPSRTIHRTTTIEDFLLEAHSHKTCGNLLDLQNMRPEAPTWMK
jgi:hypothetical protein